jgi:SAM-dependent methyltransferase
MKPAVLALALAFVALPLRAQQDVPFLESPDYVVDAMLDLAQVKDTDIVYDLGSGDGRIVIAAAKARGAHGVGIEIEHDLVELSRKNAEEAGVAERVEFVEADIFESDFREATVVALYLWKKVNERLRPLLEKQLAPGTRVVSHRFEIPGWTPKKRVKVGDRVLFLYVVPHGR